MKLAEVVERYAGGQIEIQNQGEQYLYRGDIDTICVQGDELKVKLKWLAKGEGFPPLPKKWIKDDKEEYIASLQIYKVSAIGNGCMCLHSAIVGEMVVLYPPGGSRLDPSKVEGLEVKTG